MAMRRQDGTMMALGAGLAAAASYFFDRRSGRRRRSLLVDKVRHVGAKAQKELPRAWNDLVHQGAGAVAETRHALLKQEPVDDSVLEERVHSALGRAVSHPGAIQVRVSQGQVALGGPILSDEVDSLLQSVASVSGVKSVTNELEPHETPDHIPSLQGEGRRNYRSGFFRENWSPAQKLLASLAGAGLAAYGVKKRGPMGLLSGLAGAGLATRGLTNLSVRRMTGIGAGHRAIDIQKTFQIQAAPEKVYAFFSKPQNFPETMESPKRITSEETPGTSRWRVSTVAGIPVTWKARITEEQPNRVIRWETLPGSTVRHAGALHFEPNGEGGTRVHIQMSYNPPLGAIGHGCAKLLGIDAKRYLDEEGLRVKTFLETGTRPRHASERQLAS